MSERQQVGGVLDGFPGVQELSFPALSLGFLIALPDHRLYLF